MFSAGRHVTSERLLTHAREAGSPLPVSSSARHRAPQQNKRLASLTPDVGIIVTTSPHLLCPPTHPLPLPLPSPGQPAPLRSPSQTWSAVAVAVARAAALAARRSRFSACCLASVWKRVLSRAIHSPRLPVSSSSACRSDRSPRDGLVLTTAEGRSGQTGRWGREETTGTERRVNSDGEGASLALWNLCIAQWRHRQ